MSPPASLEAALSAFEDPAAKSRDLLRLHRSWAHTRQVPERMRGLAARADHQRQGYPFWMFGPRPAPRKSDGLGFGEEARWRESDVGTDSHSTAMEELRPGQILGLEHVSGGTV
ncbi:MAG: hypothetical protein ABIQ53_01300 [Terracoccus sp.]